MDIAHCLCFLYTFPFSGGQEHIEQVQRGGGEAFAHFGRAGLRLCIRDHFKLRMCRPSQGYVLECNYCAPLGAARPFGFVSMHMRPIQMS